MPAVSLVCPHCEKPVEVQVTGVTRSRPCPECGEMLMLQVAEKSKKNKRRALLMGGAVPETPTTSTLQIPAQKTKPSAPAAERPAPAPASTGRFETKKEPATSERPAPSPKWQDQPDTEARTLNFVPSHEPQALPGDAFERMRMDPEIKEFRKRLILGSSIVALCIVLVFVIRMLTSGDETTAVIEKAPEAPALAPLVEEEPEPAPVPNGSLVFKASGKQDFAKATVAEPAPGITSSQLSMDAALSIEALRKFLSAPNWKERLAWSRPLEGIEQRMAAYYAKQGDGPVPYENIVESREADGPFFEHTVVVEGGGRRLAIVEKTSKGPRVDWAAFVGLGDMSWEQFTTEKPASPTTMRVLVGEGYYYENQFGSPRLLKCLELRCVSEPGAQMIHGYIERDSSIAQKIEFWLKNAEGASIPLTLRLKYPLNAPSPKQVWVTEIVRQGWVDG